MPKPPNMVIYQGESIGLNDLAKSKGHSAILIYHRWRRIGRPTEVTDEIFALPGAHGEPPSYTLDGVLMSAEAIAAIVGTTKYYVVKMGKRHGKQLTQQHFKSYKPAVAARGEKFQDERSPGWLERKLFPDAGKSGFNKVERGNFDGRTNVGGNSWPVYAG